MEFPDGSVTEGVKMVMFMPDTTWFAIGFGDSMINTDMISWNSRFDNSVAIDYFSDARDYPKIDLEQDLYYEVETFEMDEEDEYPMRKVRITTKRPLDTGDIDEDYIIKLDEDIDMVWAFRFSDEIWKIHQMKGWWTLNLKKEHGNLAELPLIPEIPEDDRIDITPEIKIEVDDDLQDLI